MKVVNFFAQVFAVFAFLTIGSLLMIVSIHLLSLEDALLKLQSLYESPAQSFQTGVVGLCFIVVGLIFTKMLVKTGRQTDALIVQSESGPIMVSVGAIEDAVKKTLKRFHLIKECKTKVFVEGKNVSIRLRLVLWSGSNVPELLGELQDQARGRVSKLLGRDNKLEINCDVQQIEDHEIFEGVKGKEGLEISKGS